MPYAELALEPVAFQPHVVAQHAEELAPRRYIVTERADLGIDGPRGQRVAQPLHLCEHQLPGVVHERKQRVNAEPEISGKQETLEGQARTVATGADRNDGEPAGSGRPADL